MAELSEAEQRVTALVEANKWASTRGAAGAHPGSTDVLDLAGKFYDFLAGVSAKGANDSE